MPIATIGIPIVKKWLTLETHKKSHYLLRLKITTMIFVNKMPIATIGIPVVKKWLTLETRKISGRSGEY